MIEKNKIMILCSICTLIFVSGGRKMPSACHSEGSLDPKKSRKTDTQKRASPVKIPATDAVCVKVASSLTFCAHSSLQSFSTSDKMKGPKTGPPGGTIGQKKKARQEGPLSILRGSTFGSLLKYIFASTVKMKS